MHSSKFNTKLVAQGYLFIKDKSSNNKYYWHCEFKETLNCKGRAITLLENEEQQN